MLKAAFYAAAKTVFSAGSRDFFRHTAFASACQKALLIKTLQHNQYTVYGKKHAFARIKGVSDYQNQVPLTRYEDYIPYIEKIKGGSPNILTARPVTLLEPTSGSTGAVKYIPYTNELKKQFNQGIYPWLYDIYNTFPKLKGLKQYWSLSPQLKLAPSSSRVPVGFTDDAQYLGLARGLFDLSFVVPRQIRAILNSSDFRFVTLLFLLKQRTSLGLISVWSPSFLNLLLNDFEENHDELLHCLDKGIITRDVPDRDFLSQKLGMDPRGSANMQKIIEEQGFAYEMIFPNLQVVSCWGDANAEMPYELLKKRLGPIYMQKKGLLSTECFVSFPLCALPEGHIVSYRSHFFEFIDEERGTVSLLADLKKGQRYAVAVTTGGGLYRYQTEDVIRVVDFYQGLPVIKFLGRGSGSSDYAGEKLHEIFVAEALKEFCQENNLTPAFAMLAPRWDGEKHGYILLIENSSPLPPGMSRQLETLLCKNIYYEHAVRFGQLLPLKIQEVGHGEKKYLERCMQEFGQKQGDIKPCCLTNQPGWKEYMTGDK